MSQDQSEVSSLGYMVFESTQEVLEGMVVVYRDVIGTGLVREADGSVSVRLDGRPFRIRIIPGETNRLVAIGWQVPAVGFDLLVAKLAKSGIALSEGSPEQAEARAVERLASFTDTDGFTHEFHIDRPIAPDTELDPLFVCGNETNGVFSMGHVVQIVSSAQATREFYCKVLGFGISDRITWPAADLFFLHCNQRHHTVALSEPALGLEAGAVHHIMFEAKSKDQIDAAYARVHEHGFPVVMTLGQHTNDDVYSFYMATPAGFAVEFGYGSKVVNRETWEFANYDAPSSWGHELQLAGKP